MFSLIKSNFAFGLAGALLVGGLMYAVNDYIHVKSAYKVAQKTITQLEHQRQEEGESMIIVEEKTHGNFSRQREAILEMDRNGFIATNDGFNPKWLRATSQNGG